MTLRSFARALACLALMLAGTSSCLRGEKVDALPEKCGCDGVHCIESADGVGKVSRLQASEDYGEGDNPCLHCSVTEIGVCAEGCGLPSLQDIRGCSVAYACRTWDRIQEGAPCANDRDCEPGEVNGEPKNTLACVAGACSDVGAAKFTGATATPCAEQNPFAPAPECAPGSVCLGDNDYSVERTCSPARCIGDSDCPPGWRCRCLEESTAAGLKAYRWCVPVLPSDAGT